MDASASRGCGEVRLRMREKFERDLVMGALSSGRRLVSPEVPCLEESSVVSYILQLSV